MNTRDQIHFASQVLSRHRFRTAMMFLAVSIGVASVILLTALGESARRFVLGEFASMGSDLLIMVPGKKETTGGMPPIMGEAERDITLQDVRALQRIPLVREAVPIIAGTGEASFEALSREVTVIGTTHRFMAIRDMTVVVGKKLPAIKMEQSMAVTVLGSQLKQELFGPQRAVGQWVRVGDRRYRVVGVAQGKGQSLAMDLSDTLYIPVASAQSLFNVAGMFRVMIEPRPGADLATVKQRVLAVMKDQHEGFEDVTLISQDSMLGAFNAVFDALTAGVGSIAAISMLVAGILIMNVTLITVSQRTEEIGLLKALGASRRVVLTLFLTEAAIIAGMGSLLGVGVAWLVQQAALQWVPQFPISIPWWSILVSVTVAIVTGLLFAYLPARRASQLEPVKALMKQM